jgi:hypothetical protein
VREKQQNYAAIVNSSPSYFDEINGEKSYFDEISISPRRFRYTSIPGMFRQTRTNNIRDGRKQAYMT